jgi:hypothetical protein
MGRDGVGATGFGGPLHKDKGGFDRRLADKPAVAVASLVGQQRTHKPSIIVKIKNINYRKLLADSTL